MRIEFWLAGGLCLAWLGFPVFASIREIRGARKKAAEDYSMGSRGVAQAPIGELAKEKDRWRLFYSDFEASQAQACCAAVSTVFKYQDSYVEFTTEGRVLCKVYVRYCPQCGRKVEKVRE